jgi:dCTP deaminase
MGVLSDWQIQRDVKIEPFAPNEKREGKISYGNGSYGYDMRVGYVFDVFSPINSTEIDPKNFDKGMLVRKDLTPNPRHIWCNTNPDATGYPYACITCGKLTHVKNIPNDFESNYCYNRVADHLLIPPHSFALGESVEQFEIPRDTLCIVIGKSTYARCGIVVNVTPLEPEWKGKVTIEISNTTPLPARIYCGEGIAQCVFLRTDGYREITEGITLASLDTVTHKQAMRELEGATCRVSYVDKKGRYQSQTGITLPSADSSSAPKESS